MIHSASVIKWAGLSYSSHVILDDNGVPLLAPSLFLANLSIEGRSKATILNYAYRLNTYFDVLRNSDGMDWKLVNDEVMTAYINGYLMTELGLSRPSISGHIAAISTFYDWSWDHGYLESPATYSYSIYVKGEPTSYQKGLSSVTKVYVDQYISDEKFNDLLGKIKTNDPFLIERNELILLFAKCAGLRRAEIMDSRNLTLPELRKFEDNTSNNDHISIIGKGEKLRRVPIIPGLQDKIVQFINGRHRKTKSNNLICGKYGNPLNVSIPNNLFKLAAAELNDPYWDTRVFHSLRHTYATNMVTFCYENEMDPWQLLPEYMGHNNSDTTLGYVAFEAVMNSRHSLLKKLYVGNKHINRRVKNV